LTDDLLDGSISGPGSAHLDANEAAVNYRALFGEDETLQAITRAASAAHAALAGFAARAALPRASTDAMLELRH
jgi:hypothetical protein